MPDHPDRFPRHRGSTLVDVVEELVHAAAPSPTFPPRLEVAPVFRGVEFMPRRNACVEFREQALCLVIRSHVWHGSVQRGGRHALPAQPTVNVPR